MYKKFFISIGIILAIPLLGFGCTKQTQESNLSVPATTVEDVTTPTSTETVSEEHTIYRVYEITQKQNAFTMTIASTTMFGGNSATEQAIEETGCTPEDISSCAGSLNNGFYISKKMSKKFSVSLPTDAPVVILQGGADPFETTPEHLYSLFTQTDAFLMGDYWTPFIIEIENGTVLKIDQQYIP